VRTVRDGIRNTLFGFAAFFLAANTARADQIQGLFNTGVDPTGARLQNGDLETHFMLTRCTQTCASNVSSPVGPCTTTPIPTVAVAGKLDSLWVTAPAGSEWVHPFNPSQNGTFIYRLTFDLTGLKPATAAITGKIASDNQAKIVLNGVDTGFAIAGNLFGTLTPFSITSGFVAGVNTLELHVCNWGGTTGLLVADLTGTADRVCTGTVAHYGLATPGTGGVAPTIALFGCPMPDSIVTVGVAGGLGSAWGYLVFGHIPAAIPLCGGTLLVTLPALAIPHQLTGPTGLAGVGTFSRAFDIPDDPAILGLTVYFQAGYVDFGAPCGLFSMTDGLAVTM
jgi:hypothetical protein